MEWKQEAVDLDLNFFVEEEDHDGSADEDDEEGGDLGFVEDLELCRHD